MDKDAAARTELTPLVLPRRGLEELLRGWTSDGQVFEALSAVGTDDLVVDWSAQDIQRRADRVILERVEADICRLPDSASKWREQLPMTVASQRTETGQPARPMDWATTARRYGWLPQTFVSNPRSRVRDEMTLQVLAWTATRLDGMVHDLSNVARHLIGRVQPGVLAMVEVVRQELPDVEIVRPDRLDIRALSTSGTPWSLLARVAEELLRAETDLQFLAFQIIEPVPELEWRLFHLSVLGEVLAAMRSLGGQVRWTAPLSASEAPGPQFQVRLGRDVWDVWFEASGAPKHYGVLSPYRKATASVGGAQQSIGADILLCLPRAQALALECKWSASSGYVGREGYHQASSYLVEIRAGIADDARSYLVGPEEVVPRLSEAMLDWPGGLATVGSCNISHIAELVHRSVLGTTS